MGSVDVDGVSLYVEDQGVGEPVVFVHGIPTDYRAWAAQVSAFSGRYRTVTYSRRYAYPNTRAGDVLDSTVENNAKDLAGLLAHLDAGPVHLVGHSYGGYIAAYLAATRPELLRSLTLVEPAIVSLLLKDPKSKAEALRLLLRHPWVALSASRFLRTSNAPALQALRRGEPEKAVRLNLDGIEARAGALDRLAAPVRQMMLDNDRTVAETETPFPLLRATELGRFRVPTLIVHGRTGALWLRAIAQMAGRQIPGATTVELQGSGHFPHLQEPEAFNSALARFLERLPRTGPGRS